MPETTRVGQGVSAKEQRDYLVNRVQKARATHIRNILLENGVREEKNTDRSICTQKELAAKMFYYGKQQLLMSHYITLKSKLFLRKHCVSQGI